MVAAVLCLASLFVFPMWRITLIAPQYPDGVTMYIWVNKLSGKELATIQNINILNHYVGMKYIEEDSIPELKYFPVIVGFMMLLGLVFAWLDRKVLYLSWVVILVILAVLGIYDFYLWEYDYGHNLSKTAPIKIPGASFQPPLIGTKQIINFTAQSYPHIAGYFAGFAILFAALAWWFKSKKYQLKETIANHNPVAGVSALAISGLLIGSCAIEPVPVDYGSDVCGFCKMTIVDARHAAELVTKKGKVFKFDAIECMTSQLDKEDESKYQFILVNNFNDPGNWIDATQSSFLISNAIPSPMGAFLSAFETKELAMEVQTSKGGEVYDWTTLKTHLKTSGFILNPKSY